MLKVGRYLAQTVLSSSAVTDRAVMLMFPRLSVTYLDTAQIFAHRRAGIDHLKSLFGTVSRDGADYTETPWRADQGVAAVTWSQKYRHDLFYILPFHHLELPQHLTKE